MFVWTEGQEFSLEDTAGWDALQVAPGMIMEVLLSEELAGGHTDLWAGLLAQSVHLNQGGTDEAYLEVFVKSLGCSDAEVSKKLSNAFNRRSNSVHLCIAEPCPMEDEFALHVTRLRLYSVEGFNRDYMTATGTRQLKKWLEDLGLEDPTNRPLPPGHVARDAEWDLLDEHPPKAEAREAEREKPAGILKPGRAGREDPEVSHADREKLRRRLAKAKDLMAGRQADAGAGKRAVRRGDGEDLISISSSEGYLPSPLENPVKEEDKIRKKSKGGTKPSHRPLDPLGPSRALAIPGKELKRSGAPLDRGQGSAPKKKKTKAARGDEEQALVAISGSTTTNLQKQLMKRAAEAVEERKAHKKEKKNNKDPGKKLAAILTKVVGKKKKKGSKKKRKKRRHGHGGDPPGGDSEDSSGTSRTSNYDDGSNDESDEEDSSSSESKKMQPPLRRKALEHPGSVMRMLIEHAREKLDQTSKVSVGRREEEDPTQGIRISTYFQIVVRPQLASGSPQLRELHLLAHAVDLLRSGELDGLGDLLASRFVSLHQAGLDGHWGAARHMEVLSYDDTTAAGPAIVLRARRHARMAAQVAGNEPGNWKGGGKGRGKYRTQWEDNSWQADGKGRGKKGDKGRTKGKGAWKGQGQDTGSETRQKERVPEK